MWTSEQPPQTEEKEHLIATGSGVIYQHSGVSRSEMRSCNDLVFAALFLVVLVAMVALAGYGFSHGHPTSLVPLSSLPPEVVSAARAALADRARAWLHDSIARAKHDLPVIVGALAFAFVLSIVWTFLMKTFTKIL